MKKYILKPALLIVSILLFTSVACQALTLDPTEVPLADAQTEAPATMPSQNGFPDKPAIPNDSGIEGVQTFPDKAAYHDHVKTLDVQEGNMPPVFGAHFSAWQNCGIYDQPTELGSALHSMEHGAVWLTYSPDLGEAQIADLQELARGHGYVLMSPYSPQIKPVVLTAWGVQLVIDALPDERIAKFISYYEQGPQNPEAGAPCSGAIGNPLP